MADTQRERVVHREIGMDLAERVVLDLLESGWSRQSLRKHEAAGPTPCGTAFYLVRDGGIAVAYFPIAEFTDANGRGLFFPIRDFFPPVQKSAHGEVDSLEPFKVGDQVLSMDRDLEGSWNYEDEVRASDWHLLIPVFTVVSVRPHPGHHTQFGGRDYYQVKIKDRVGGSGGCHDLVPIAGRPWQMRGEGECLIRIRPAPFGRRGHSAGAARANWTCLQDRPAFPPRTAPHEAAGQGCAARAAGRRRGSNHRAGRGNPAPARRRKPCHRAAARCAGHELKEDNMPPKNIREITVAELHADLQPIEVVAVRTSLGQSSIYRRMKEDTFPHSYKIGARAVWLKEDIDRFIAEVTNPQNVGENMGQAA
ncbi:AlpA family phage regulatory protein [Stenotrophomonas maltophilia]|nr:AlpA family phage regulatory protein [Stenotrophomonas maltophilia]